MESRRDFLRKLGTLPLGAGALSSSLRKALAIEADPGSTCLDAEHVVILMQENRSFDHTYGTLRGVRGFGDPRAVTLPDGNPVWLQTNAAGETHAPFRLDLLGSKSTWMGCLPHNWGDQNLTRNGGLHDLWLHHKQSGHAAYAGLPLTLGFHGREDLPFYYALADAFTVCDQNFCSVLTGTTPNRLHLWSGTIRAEQTPESRAGVRNNDADHTTNIGWKTFPERLEEAGIPWCVYQNEIDLDTGLGGEAAGWLSNFGDNPLEYCSQFGVRFARARREFVAGRAAGLARELEAMVASSPEPRTEENTRAIEALRRRVAVLSAECEAFSETAFEALSDYEKALHRRAFVTNGSDPHYRELEEIRYRDGDTERTMKVPKGDILHQFRADVEADRLPTVSWLVAPQVFSDHPDGPWYGAWYISEALDILTRRPDVWKKTIFILCYDENDGYFDHVPPFVPPDPEVPDSGKASEGLDPGLEHVRAAQEEAWRRDHPRDVTTPGPIGLGYRVPLVIASPWSRGGFVCSEVFDHTSILRFLEKFLTHKTGKPVVEPNISPWRRAICGDLLSAFRAAGPEGAPVAKVERGSFLPAIHRAGFRPVPATPGPLTAVEIAAARQNPRAPVGQEPGTRPACALPYELSAQGALGPDKQAFVLTFEASRRLFGERAAGAPFHAYAPGLARTRAYAVKAGDRISDAWRLADFPEGRYEIRVHGPNGFYREFRGSADDPSLAVSLDPYLADDGSPTGDLAITFTAPIGLALILAELAYGDKPVTRLTVEAGVPLRHRVPLAGSHGWHDLSITAEGHPHYAQRHAGHLEIGRESQSDPLIG